SAPTRGTCGVAGPGVERPIAVREAPAVRGGSEARPDDLCPGRALPVVFAATEGLRALSARAHTVLARSCRAVLIACGAALFVYLVLRSGPAAVVESFRSLSWRLLVVIVFPCVVLKMFDALAWRFAFPDAGAPLLSLSAGLLAGQAVASITPSGALGEKAVM